MTSIRPHSPSGWRFGLRFSAGSAWLLLAVSPISVLAQGFGPDPFRPFNSQYDSYVYPIAPGPLDSVGNPSLNRSGIRGANQFEDYMSRVGSSNIGNRYDQLYRSQISGLRRQFNPTREADAKFEEQQEALNKLYFDYLRESDPRKRAALLKQYNQARSRSTRELSAGGRSAGGRKPRKATSDAAQTKSDKAKTAAEEPTEGEATDKPETIVSPPRRTGRDDARQRATAPTAPPISGSSRSGTRTRERKPSEVLDRAIRSEVGGPESSARPRGSSNPPPPPPVTP
jgi:hypothetical protein